MTAAPYQFFRSLTEEEYAALKTSIAEHGVRVPVAVQKSTGRIIDGHHRRQVADELGIPCPVNVHDVDDRAAALLAGELNSDRRENTAADRRETVLRYAVVVDADGVGEYTQAEIARAAGVGQATVSRILADPEFIQLNKLPERRRTADGKVRSATSARPKAPEPAPSPAAPEPVPEQATAAETEHAQVIADLAKRTAEAERIAAESRAAAAEIERISAAKIDAAERITIEAVQVAQAKVAEAQQTIDDFTTRANAAVAAAVDAKKEEIVEKLDAGLKDENLKLLAQSNAWNSYAQALSRFPDLVYYAGDPDKVLALAATLESCGEPERGMRLENLRKAIDADQRRKETPKTPESAPDHYRLADAMFRVTNEAAKVITRGGGAATVSAALAGAEELMITTWRDQFADMATLCREIAESCTPKLRRIK